MAHEPNETEWQFDAVDLRPVVRWLEEPSGLARRAAHARRRRGRREPSRPLPRYGRSASAQGGLRAANPTLGRRYGPKRRLRGFRRRPTTTDCVVAGRSRAARATGSRDADRCGRAGWYSRACRRRGAAVGAAVRGAHTSAPVLAGVGCGSRGRDRPRRQRSTFRPPCASAESRSKRPSRRWNSSDSSSGGWRQLVRSSRLR